MKNEDNERLLITKEQEKLLAKLGEQDVADPTVVVRWFDPYSSYTYYVTAYYPKEGNVFGYVVGLAENELGYTSIAEVKALQFLGILRIERDINFTPCKLSECRKIYGFN